MQGAAAAAPPSQTSADGGNTRVSGAPNSPVGKATAAEIDGTDFAASLTDFGFLFRLRNDFVGANPAVAAFPSIAAEAAEYAVVSAKRNMRIS